MASMNEREALDATVNELRAVKVRLEKQRDELTLQITEKDRVLRFWESRLAELNGGVSAGSKRLKKGEPLRRITEVYDTAKPGVGMSASDIAEKSAMGWSTVRTTLKKHTARFVEREGLWYRKETDTR